MKRIFVIFILFFATACSAQEQVKTIWLEQLDLEAMEIGWGTPKANKSVDGNDLCIAGQKFRRGVGTHAISTFLINLDMRGVRFITGVGVDDETGERGSIRFYVLGDKKILWDSGVMTGKDRVRRLDLDISGIKLLGLLVTEAGDNINYDHADWVDARFIISGEQELSDLVILSRSARSVPYILTPPALDKPMINGTRIIGARPGNPILFHIPATGKRPMTFSVSHLPVGLVLDQDLGRLQGKIEKEGLYRLAIIAENEFGMAKRELRISVGDRICLTPPMGWNSWNCWATSVDDAKVRASAKAMKESGLINHGWTYINIDDTWEDRRGGEFNGIQPNSKFPDMKSLSDYIHGLGLKIGIYSTPWITTYAGFCGGSSDDINGKWNKEEAGNRQSWRHGKYAFDVNDAAQWAQWGIDYLKYDWNPNSVKETRRMKEELESCGRDIIFSLSNSAPFELAHEWAKLANCWRTTGDIRDTWSSMSRIGFSQDRWRKFAGPGHWNDPDMLVVGLVGWGPDLHPTRLTPDEQYTHISLWSLLSAPLLLGCDLSRLDDFTMNLLTSDEVIEINQDPMGRQAKLLLRKDGKEIWVKEMEDGSKAVGLFWVSEGNGNPADYFDWDMNKEKKEITVKWSDLGISGRHIVRDVWRQKDLGVFSEKFTTEVSYHGVVLIRVFNAGL